MAHTQEFLDTVRCIRERLALDPAAGAGEAAAAADRFGVVLSGLREGLASPAMMRAAQIMFEDYLAVRVCVRGMMKLFVRRLDRRRAAAG